MIGTRPFIPRVPELLALEGNYDGIVLSCRHRDILRCSETRHFSSCFSRKGCYSIMPVVYCYHPEVCIIFKRDKSGAFLGRVFGFYVGNNRINLAKVYGNELSVDKIRSSIREITFVETHGDVYFPVH